MSYKSRKLSLFSAIGTTGSIDLRAWQCLQMGRRKWLWGLQVKMWEPRGLCPLWLRREPGFRREWQMCHVGFPIHRAAWKQRFSQGNNGPLSPELNQMHCVNLYISERVLIVILSWMLRKSYEAKEIASRSIHSQRAIFIYKRDCGLIMQKKLCHWEHG